MFSRVIDQPRGEVTEPDRLIDVITQPVWVGRTADTMGDAVTDASAAAALEGSNDAPAPGRTALEEVTHGQSGH